jgi:hypothetical protein
MKGKGSTNARVCLKSYFGLDDLCAVCKHRPECHGNLQKLKPEDIDRIVGLVIQIEHNLQEAQRNGDPVKRQKHMEIATQFKQ